MNKREAKAEALLCAAPILRCASDSGLWGDFDGADSERLSEAMYELAAELDRRGTAMEARNKKAKGD